MLWQKIRSGGTLVIKKAYTNRLFSRRSIFILAVLMVAIFLAAYMKTRPRLAPRQTPLADIATIETLRTQFNQDVGKTRLIILVSPT